MPQMSALSHMSDASRRTSLALGALALAFLARVVGQIVVMLAAPSWLPPADAWYSGLVPYEVLLPSQVLILGLQARVSRDLWRGHGRFARRAPRVGVGMRRLAVVYALGMLVRYVVTMTLYPEQRWLGHTIPVVFHWVLAGYLYVWSRYLTGPRR